MYLILNLRIVDIIFHDYSFDNRIGDLRGS